MKRFVALFACVSALAACGPIGPAPGRCVDVATPGAGEARVRGTPDDGSPETSTLYPATRTWRCVGDATGVGCDLNNGTQELNASLGLTRTGAVRDGDVLRPGESSTLTATFIANNKSTDLSSTDAASTFTITIVRAPTASQPGEIVMNGTVCTNRAGGTLPATAVFNNVHAPLTNL